MEVGLPDGGLRSGSGVGSGCFLGVRGKKSVIGEVGVGIRGNPNVCRGEQAGPIDILVLVQAEGIVGCG